MQTRIIKQELPFLCYFESTYTRKHIGYYDMVKKKLTKTHLLDVSLRCCIQVCFSLLAYDLNNYWSSFTDLHKNCFTEKKLAAPIFSARDKCSMASYQDRLIFVTGGTTRDARMPMRGFIRSFKGVFCYDIGSGTWTEAPEMNEARDSHGSTILNTTLYVYAGYGLSGALGRLINIDCGVFEATASWETLQIADSAFTGPLILPLN